MYNPKIFQMQAGVVDDCDEDGDVKELVNSLIYGNIRKDNFYIYYLNIVNKVSILQSL